MWNISASARRNLLLISALALCSLPMYGRTGNTGTIAVSVSDPSGAPVGGAAAAINSESTQARSHYRCRGKFLGPIPIAGQLLPNGSARDFPAE
jgi:hypothetical protein